MTWEQKAQCDAEVAQRPESISIWNRRLHPTWGEGDTHDVAALWHLPFGADPRPFNPDHLGSVVSVLDAGGLVVVFGTDPAALEHVMDVVLPFVGGTRA